MSDTTTTDDAQTGDDAAKTGDEKKDGTRSFTQAEVDRMIGARLHEERAKFDGHDELKAKAAELDKLKESQQTEQEKLERRATEAEKRAEKAEADNRRLQVAIDKELVGDRAALAKRLSGSTKEELEADADDLLKLVGPAKRPDDTETDTSTKDEDADKNGDTPKGPGMDGGTRKPANDNETDAKLDKFWNERAGIYEPTK